MIRQNRTEVIERKAKLLAMRGVRLPDDWQAHRSEEPMRFTGGEVYDLTFTDAAGTPIEGCVLLRDCVSDAN